MAVLDSFTALASEVWRKYVTANVPASGLHQPDLDEVEQWGTDVEAVLVAISLQTAEPQIVTGSTGTVADDDGAVAVQRTAPTLTTLALPSVADRSQLRLSVFDWSSSITEHEIKMNPHGSETIMTRSTWSIFSTADQLAGITLVPSEDLSGWYIAP